MKESGDSSCCYLPSYTVKTHTQSFYNIYSYIDNQQDFESVITRLMPTKQDNTGGEH